LNPAVCKRVLLLALLAGTAPLWAASEPLDSARDLEQSERSYRDAIRAIETSHGAYGADLPEQILSLGHTLQNQGRHREAVELFKRGVHLSRINDCCRGRSPATSPWGSTPTRTSASTTCTGCRCAPWNRVNCAPRP
jgi:hypothetical protein